MLDKQDVQALVDTEILQIGDEALRREFEAKRVSPEMQMRVWDYGEDEELYPCWIVAKYSSTFGIAYSEYGFGQSDIGHPWGRVDLAERNYSQDGLWRATLAQAVKAFRPSRYDEQGPSSSLSRG